MTVVGSGRARVQLPFGREALERAIRLCVFWGAASPSDACAQAYEHEKGDAVLHGFPTWLPSVLRNATLVELRLVLRAWLQQEERAAHVRRVA